MGGRGVIFVVDPSDARGDSTPSWTLPSPARCVENCAVEVMLEACMNDALHRTEEVPILIDDGLVLNLGDELQRRALVRLATHDEHTAALADDLERLPLVTLHALQPAANHRMNLRAANRSVGLNKNAARRETTATIALCADG